MHVRLDTGSPTTNFEMASRSGFGSSGQSIFTPLASLMIPESGLFPDYGKSGL
jgi:hypothetical protein